MLSEQCDRLRETANELRTSFTFVGFGGAVSREPTACKAATEMEEAARTIDYLGMVGADNAKLREAIAELWPRASLTMRPDDRAEWEERLKEMGVVV